MNDNMFFLVKQLLPNRSCLLVQIRRCLHQIPDISGMPVFLREIEKKWAPNILGRSQREAYNVVKKEKSSDKRPLYLLSMFPYPSGNLHLGHVKIYTSVDIQARFWRHLLKCTKRQYDFDYIINPMGFDSFGLPAENAAIDRGMDPSSWTQSNIRRMKQQLDSLALYFDWREATSNPSYYKWTQDLFINLLENKLAYKTFSYINWDPKDKTVLADEQVDSEGRSWRSGVKVEKKLLRQWSIKTSAFAEQLYNGEDIKDEPSWKEILNMQRGWMGKPNGWVFYLPLKLNDIDEHLLIFTEKPELFICENVKLKLSSNHWLKAFGDDYKIINPFSDKILDIEFVNEVDSLPSNTQATLSSSSSQRNDDATICNRDKVLAEARSKDLGGYFTSCTYRDWVVSRQRFWGTPIPTFKFNKIDRPVDRNSLPVILPKVDFGNFKKVNIDHSDWNHYMDQLPTPLSMLSSKDWIEYECPKTGVKGTRECETLDTMFDSSWYFLRYASRLTENEPFNPKKVQPVSCYVGGKEHATMHLLYARFMTHFLHSIGKINFREPFKKLLMHGPLKGKTYKLENGRYVSKEEAIELSKNKIKVLEQNEKMSKSKGNGIDPSSLLNTYGIDATRLCLISYANPTSERNWRDNHVEYNDVIIFLRRLLYVVDKYSAINQTFNPVSCKDIDAKKKQLNKTKNSSLIEILSYIQTTGQMRQYISSMHIMLNSLRSNLNSDVALTKEYAELLGSLLIVLSPVCPHFAEDMWSRFTTTQINPLRLHESRFNLDLQAADQPWPLADDSDTMDEKKNKPKPR